MATDVVDTDLTDAALYRDGFPHELFTELRRAGAVHRHRPATNLIGENPTPFWSVVRHDAIQQANRDWETFSAVDGPGMAPSSPEQRGYTIVAMDPPDHTRTRRLVSAGFTPRMIGRLEEHIARRTELILDAVEAQAEERGGCDIVRDVAYPLPMHIIADIIGIPDADRAWVFERTDTMLRALDPASGLSAADRRGAEIDLFRYAQELGRAKREHPADDVWTTIIHAAIDDGAGASVSLSELDVDMFFVILAIAGSETTRNAISQGVLALSERPDQLALLRDDPSLMASATEELLRWSSPVLFFGRTATRDVEIGGVQVAAGDRVVLWYPSGNRDEAAFADPFRFDVRRDPNPHVSFGGGGPHFCLGASLARKEVQVMTAALLGRFDIEIAGPPAWSGSGPVHNVGVSLEHLAVRLVRRRH